MSDQEEQFTNFDEIDIDLTDKKAWDGDYKLIDVGDYELEIVGFTKEAGNVAPYIKVTFEVVTEGEFKGQKVWNNYSLSEKAVGRMKALMVAAGTSLNKIIAAEFMNARIMATIVHNPGKEQTDAEGNVLPVKMFANVSKERPVEGAAVEEPAPTPPPVARGNSKAATKPATNAARRT